MGNKGTIEVLRCSPRIGHCVARGTEGPPAFAAPSRRGNGFAVSHVLQRPFGHLGSLMPQESRVCDKDHSAV